MRNQAALSHVLEHALDDRRDPGAAGHQQRHACVWVTGFKVMIVIVIIIKAIVIVILLIIKVLVITCIIINNIIVIAAGHQHRHAYNKSLDY